jgi:hypothetical protein
MIVFTILGVLVYWYVMGVLGYLLGWYLDFRRGMAAMLEPVDREVKELRVMLDCLTVYAKENG